MKKILRLTPNMTMSVMSGEMPCPFLSRLSSQFVKNYSGKLLKTYGDHCPVMSHQSKQGVSIPCQPVKLVDNKDVIEVRDGNSEYLLSIDNIDDNDIIADTGNFEYESFFAGEIEKKKMEHSYRVFKKVMRDASKFPAAKEYTMIPKVTIS